MLKVSSNTHVNKTGRTKKTGKDAWRSFYIRRNISGMGLNTVTIQEWVWNFGGLGIC